MLALFFFPSSSSYFILNMVAYIEMDDEKRCHACVENPLMKSQITITLDIVYQKGAVALCKTDFRTFQCGIS